MSITELLVLTSSFWINAKDSISRFLIMQEKQIPVCLNQWTLSFLLFAFKHAPNSFILLYTEGHIGNESH
jgi:hypothetical protein